MKKLILILATILLIGSTARANVRNLGDVYQAIYTVTSSTGAHVTGQTVALKIKKASNGYWYDWSDSTFKASGWTNKTRTLTEDATNGYYYYSWTPPVAETASEEYVFVYTNTDATYGDNSSEVVTYQTLIAKADVQTAMTSQGYSTARGGYLDNVNHAIPNNTDYSTVRAAKLDYLDAAVSSRSTYAGGAVASVTGNVTGSVGSLATQAKTDVENATWDAVSASHNTAGTTGNKLSAAATAGDPWTASVPGAYPAGTAGYIVGNNLNATVSSRSSHTAANVASLILTTPANLLVTDGTGRVTVGTNADKSGYSITDSTWTTARANKLDYLDAATSSRMATFSYTAPDNTNIGNTYNILTSTWTTARANKIDNLDATISSRGTSNYAGADVGITQAGADKVWGTSSRTLTAGTNIALAKGTGITGLNDIAATDVWTSGTRTLTAGTNIALAKGTGVTGFNDITAASVWSDPAGVGVSTTTNHINTSVPQTGDSYAQFGSTWTAARANKLDNLDAAVSTRGTSNYAGGAVASVTGGVTVTTNNDKSGYSITDSTWTTARAQKLDNLDATISSRGTSTLTAAGLLGTDISGYTTGDTAGHYMVLGGTRTVPAVATVDNAAIATAVWAKDISAATLNGTAQGYLVNASSSTSEVDISSTTIANAVWDDTRSHATGTAWDKLNLIGQYTDYQIHDGDYKGVSKEILIQR